MYRFFFLATIDNPAILLGNGTRGTDPKGGQPREAQEPMATAGQRQLQALRYGSAAEMDQLAEQGRLLKVEAERAEVREAVKLASRRFVVDLVAGTEAMAPIQMDGQHNAHDLRLIAGVVSTANGIASLLVPGVRARAGGAPRSGEDVEWNRAAIVDAGAVAPLSILLKAGAGSVRNAAVLVLSGLMYHDGARQQAIDSPGLLFTVVGMLRIDDSSARADALAMVRTLSIDYHNRQSIRQAGGLVSLVWLLDHPHSTPREQEAAAATLSSLAAHSTEHLLGEQNRLAMTAVSLSVHRPLAPRSPPPARAERAVLNEMSVPRTHRRPVRSHVCCGCWCIRRTKA